ncbi:MAG: hypothetical protein JW885_06895 [Deltaproteobacteria bacterium]|nr:hypothetical protein [Candidatus Zymogenaceae bacterium]
MGRLYQIIKNEFYEVAFRKKLHRFLEEIPADLDGFMNLYNEAREVPSGTNAPGDLP